MSVAFTPPPSVNPPPSSPASATPAVAPTIPDAAVPVTAAVAAISADGASAAAPSEGGDERVRPTRLTRGIAKSAEPAPAVLAEALADLFIKFEYGTGGAGEEGGGARPPASPAAVADLEASLGRPLPTSLKLLWSITDGVATTSGNASDVLFPSVAQMRRYLAREDCRMDTAVEQKAAQPAEWAAADAAVRASGEFQAGGCAGDQQCILGYSFFRECPYLPLGEWDEGQQVHLLDEATGAIIYADLEMCDPGPWALRHKSIGHAVAAELRQLAKKKLKGAQKKVAVLTAEQLEADLPPLPFVFKADVLPQLYVAIDELVGVNFDPESRNGDYY